MMLEGKTIQKYIRISPTKVRRVANLVKGKEWRTADAILEFLPHKAARLLRKSINNAYSNLVNKAGELKVKEENIWINDIIIGEGPKMKRIRPMSLGRAGLIRKRTTHITVIVQEKEV